MDVRRRLVDPTKPISQCKSTKRWRHRAAEPEELGHEFSLEMVEVATRTQVQKAERPLGIRQ